MDNSRYLVELTIIDIQMQEELFLIEMVQGHVLKIEKLSITYIDQLEVVLDLPNQQKNALR